ncbi:MAG: hypothetical protein HY280_08090 [Nitrospinae bacterium]|nr:hypothetical protein [Nitrospinota bacterium]
MAHELMVESEIFPQELFKEDYQRKIYKLFRDLIDAFGKRVVVTRRWDDKESYHIWRGELHDAQREKRVQFSFGVSDNLRMGGILKSIPFVEPDVAMRDPYEVLGPSSPTSTVLRARPSVPELIAPDAAPYSFGIFDVRKPESLLSVMKIGRDQFAKEVPPDVIYDNKPVLVVVEQNWLTKFFPRVVAPGSELFKIFRTFALNTKKLAVDGRIFSIPPI